MIANRTIKYMQEVRIGQRKEDLSSVGDYYLNCGEVILNRLVSS